MIYTFLLTTGILLLIHFPTATLALPIPAPISKNDNLQLLKKRQFNSGSGGSGSSSSSIPSSTIFITVGSLIIVLALLSVIGFSIRYRRRSLRGATVGVPGTTPRQLRRTTHGKKLKHAVISKEELDTMYPAITYDKFLEEYKAGRKLGVVPKTNNDDTDGHNDDSGEDGIDLASLTPSTMDPNLACAICQRVIGHEDEIDPVPIARNEARVQGQTDEAKEQPVKADQEQSTETLKDQDQPSQTKDQGQDPEPKPQGNQVLIRNLSCHHVFHDECIVPWLTTRRACCPLCQHDFTAPISPVTTSVTETTVNTHPINTP